jgi:hypothetical protein
MTFAIEVLSAALAEAAAQFRAAFHSKCNDTDFELPIRSVSRTRVAVASTTTLGEA